MLAQGMGKNGERVDIKTIREQWHENKVFKVVPLPVPIYLHTLVSAAAASDSPERTKLLLAKVTEILEWVWPLNTPEEMSVFPCAQSSVMIPKREL